MAAKVIKHVAVYDLLAQRIRHMEPGDRLPTEQELCAELDVSRITVRRALGDLEAEGLIVRHQGRGTFASRPALPQVFRETLSERVIGFHRQQALLGNSVTSQILSNEVVFDIGAAQRADLAPSHPLVRLERLRYVNGQLHQHDLVWLDGLRFGDVAEQDLTDASLFDYLRKAHGIELTRNELTISIVNARAGVAASLGVPEGTPLLGMATRLCDDVGLIAHGLTTHAPGFGEVAIILHASD